MNSLNSVTARWLAGFAAFIAAALIFVLLWPSPLVPGLICKATGDGEIITTAHFNLLPPDIYNDARIIADGYYPREPEKAEDLFGQLAGLYLEALDKDFLVIFNPGGWGWDPVCEIRGWESMLDGIYNTLTDLGYDVVSTDYKRTRHGLTGVIGETEELLGIQPAKSRELAARIEFLTDHLPDLRIIITGESNGASFASDVMRLLKDNSRVYAVVSGPPVWHPERASERSLVIRDNGIEADTFSNGDIIRILRANAESAFGIYRGGKGDILLYIGAPGHYYSWDYPAVREQVVDFIVNSICMELN